MSELAVIMPVHNGASYLREAIDSILKQTYKDFEFIIIDDGSTDNSLNILNSYKDKRITIQRLETRKGISDALNEGFSKSKAPLIARMDADDIALPDRLRIQIDYLKSHPEIGVLGTSLKLIPSNKIWSYPEDDSLIKARMLFNNCFAHSSVMFRRSVSNSNAPFSGTFPHMEDYDLWCHLAASTTFANLPQALLKYRQSPQSVSIMYKSEMRDSAKAFFSDHLTRLGFKFSEEELNLHLDLHLINQTEDLSPLENYITWLRNLKNQNELLRLYSTKSFAMACSVKEKEIKAKYKQEISVKNLLKRFTKL